MYQAITLFKDDYYSIFIFNAYCTHPEKKSQPEVSDLIRVFKSYELPINQPRDKSFLELWVTNFLPD